MRAQAYYGVSIGILMVNTTFRRYVGDIGNALTWPFPVQYRIVEEANPGNVVDLKAVDLLTPFKNAADELVRGGVAGIVTTCGFLSFYQKELAAHCDVPVATSSLLQIPTIEQFLPPGKRVGVLTYDGSALSGQYLDAVGVAQSTPMEGMPRDSAFRRWISTGDNSITFGELEQEVSDAAARLLAKNPDVGAIVCECTNLAPFSKSIQQRTRLSVFDAVTMVKWFQSGVAQIRYPKGD